MGSIKDQPLSGIAILEHTFTWAARDTTEITATEASPRPGSPIASSALTQAQPSISGGQDTDADVYVTRAGQPNISHFGNEGMTVAYRIGGGTWMGWNGPGFLHQMDQLGTWSSGVVFGHISAVTIPSSQKVVCVFSPSNTAEVEPVSRVLDPADWVWDAEVDVLASVSGIDYDDSAVCILPNERLVCAILTEDGTSDQWRMYFSDDAAVTWTLGSSTLFSSLPTRMGSKDIAGLTAVRTSMVANNDGDVLLVREGDDGSPFVMQYASNSQGATFKQVGSDWTTTPPAMLNTVLLRSGALAMVGKVSSVVKVWKIASPFDTIENVTPVTAHSLNAGSVAAWVDDDGLFYVAAELSGEVRIAVSRDEGATWAETSADWPGDGQPFKSGDTSTKYLPSVATTTMGRAVLIGNSVDAGLGTTYDGMVWATQLGGWSNLEITGAWSNGTDGKQYIPIELPSTITGWSAVTSGTQTSSLDSPGKLHLTTTTGTVYFSDTTLAASPYDVVGMVDLEVTTGGSQTARDVNITINVASDASNLGSAEINFTAGEYAVEDNGTARGVIDHGLEGGRIQVAFWYDATNDTFSTWYKANTGETWTQGHNAVTITQHADASGTNFQWGHIASATAVSDWYQVHLMWNATLGTLEPADAVTEYRGKALNVNSYPIPTIGPDTQVARLSMLSGPGLIGESWDIDAVSDYPLSNCYPDVSPSPRAKWRSSAIADYVIASWDAGQGTQPGQSMVIAGIGCNVPGLKLEGYRAMAWEGITTLGFSGGFSAIEYQREGNVIRANTSGDGASRFVQRNEFAGGWVDLGSSKYRKILRNTSGEWQTTADSASAKARLFLEGIDGSEGLTGTCTIYSPSSVRIAHNVKADFTEFRVSVNGNSIVGLDGYWEVGALFVGYVAYAGNRHDWGWTWGREINATTRTDRGGTTYTTQEGPAPRTLSLAWQDGVDISRHRDSTSLDFRKPTAGDPVAAVDDAAFWHLGILEEVKSGQVPVIALPYIPDADTTITDPTQFLYSRITSNAQLSHVVGDEDSAELYRGSSTQFREIV